MTIDLQKASFGGIIEITFDSPFKSGFKVHGPADDERYTRRHIETEELAVEAADNIAQDKANDLGDNVAVVSYIGHEPVRHLVTPE